MRRLGVFFAVFLLAIGVALAPADGAQKRSKRKKAAAKTRVAPDFDPKLPILGTHLAEMPPGPGKSTADSACMTCHSADMIAQQRLTEKQWAAEVTKMAGWGADVPAAGKDELVAYLVKNFGTDTPKYEPVVTRPVGR